MPTARGAISIRLPGTMPAAAGSTASIFPTTATVARSVRADAGHLSESVAIPNWDGVAADNELETALRRRGAVSSRPGAAARQKPGAVEVPEDADVAESAAEATVV